MAFEKLELSVKDNGITDLLVVTHKGTVIITLSSYELEIFSAELVNHKAEVAKVNLGLYHKKKLEKEQRRC